MEKQNHQPYQVALDLKISEKSDFNSFVPGNNAGTVQLLKNAIINKDHESYYLFGPHGSGKSHLLNALFQLPEANSKCFFVDMNLVKTIGSFVLDVNLPEITIIDNVDVIAGDENFELALFGLFNRWYDSRKGVLIMSGSCSFDYIPFSKKDLTTRLSSGVICSLDFLDEKSCIEALQKKTVEKAFNLPASTAAFLVHHCNRDIRSLVKILDELDKLQIEHYHKLTIPFVKKVLSIQ